jgi:glycosyltransferase involved in cell wall biosynthesis
MAKVDIVVPCYNYGRYLERCVQSVLQQSVGDVRVLIIDDNSSDDTYSIASQLTKSDPRVSLISHSKNYGHISTYNEGIEWAKSAYFLLLSADDLLVPGALERATSIMDSDPDIVLTYGRVLDCQDGLPFPTFDPVQNYTWLRQDLVRAMCSVGGNLVASPTAIGRTSIQKEIGGYDALLPQSCDMEMWLRYGAHGAVAKINAVQAIVGLHSSNMTIAYNDEDWSDFPHVKGAFDRFFERYANRLPMSRSLQAKAHRAFAKRVYWRGIRRICRGRVAIGLNMVRFSLELNPLAFCSMPQKVSRVFRSTLVSVSSFRSK